MRKAQPVRLLFVRMALVLPLGRRIGPKLLGLALGDLAAAPLDAAVASSDIFYSPVANP